MKTRNESCDYVEFIRAVVAKTGSIALAGARSGVSAATISRYASGVGPKEMKADTWEKLRAYGESIGLVWHEGKESEMKVREAAGTYGDRCARLCWWLRKKNEQVQEAIFAVAESHGFERQEGVAEKKEGGSGLHNPSVSAMGA